MSSQILWQRVLHVNHFGGHYIYSLVYNNDSYMDLVMSSSTGLYWYQNTGDSTFELHTIENKNNMGYVDVGDLDYDGCDDIAVVLLSYVKDGYSYYTIYTIN